MPQKPFHAFVQAAIIVSSIGVFTVLWPIGTMVLLASIPGQTFTGLDMAEGFTCLAIVCVGLPLGFHVGLLLARKTAWLVNRGTRNFFLVISALFALFITYADSAGGSSDLDGPLLYKWCYFLAVQALPIFWFAYNWHGESWLKALARQRNRRTQ